LPVVEQVPEALVRLLGGAEARELPHRPEPAAVHGRIDAARERIDAGVAEVAVVVDLDGVGCVERIVLEARDRAEELAGALGRGVVELALPVVGAADAALVFRRRHGQILPFRSLNGTTFLPLPGDFPSPSLPGAPRCRWFCGEHRA